MNANKRGVFFLFATAAVAFLSAASAFATNLDAHSNTKVQGAMAKKWAQSDGKSGGPEKQQVNIGSKRGGTCNMNVGTVQPGQKAPKEIVVTTKEIINVCK